jgi:hypothetical protein
MCVRVWSSCVVAPTQRDVPRHDAKPAVRQDGERTRQLEVDRGALDRSPPVDPSVRAFRSAFSSVREEDILSFFEKKNL